MITFAEAAEAYIKDGGSSEYLNKIVCFLGPLDVKSITGYMLMKMADELYPKVLGQTKNRQAITPACCVLNYASFRGWCLPFKARRFKVTKTKFKQPASQAWMFQFLKQADVEGHKDFAALILFMNHTAARVSEALRLEWSDVQLNERKCVLRRTKTEEDSVRYLTEDLMARLYTLDRSRQLVFGYKCRWNVNERLKSICLRAGIEYRSSHEVGRHSFATNTMNLGVGVKVAMDAGGWKTADMFLRVYSHTQNAGRIVANRLDEEKDKSGFRLS